MSSLNLFQINNESENPKTQVFENAEFGKIRVKGDKRKYVLSALFGGWVF